MIRRLYHCSPEVARGAGGTGGRDKYEISWEDGYLIHPYDRSGDLLTPTVLRSRFPHVWQYLEEHEAILRQRVWFEPGFPIWAVFRLKGQPKRDSGIIFGSCKASQSPVYPIRDAILAVNHVSCPSLSSSGPREWGESALKTSRLPGALSLLARSWLYPPSAWRRR